MAHSEEQRQWNRLALPIAVFVHATDGLGQAFTELAVAVNVGIGGALLAMRRLPAIPGRVFLELPRPPVSQGFQAPAMQIDADIVRVVHNKDHHLLGLAFTEPLRTQPSRVQMQVTEIS